MLEARMTELNRNEILLYLGYRGQEIPQELDGQIEQCVSLVEAAVQPRLVYRRLSVADGQPEGFFIGGNDIREVLTPCHEAVFLAVTLGPQIERLLMSREVTDMADAVIMDACASVAVENVCDRFEEDLRGQLAKEGLFLTSRFSPGYGDFPLDTQNRLCEALNTVRRIGLAVTDNQIMVPRKSVTAVMGISREPQTLRKRGCEACSMFRNCAYRKEGRTCGEEGGNL